MNRIKLGRALNQMVRVLWLEEAGDPLLLSGHHERVNSVTVSSTGDKVLAVFNDRTVRVWSLGIDSLKSRLRQATTVQLDPRQRHRYLGESREGAGSVPREDR